MEEIITKDMKEEYLGLNMDKYGMVFFLIGKVNDLQNIYSYLKIQGQRGSIDIMNLLERIETYTDIKGVFLKVPDKTPLIKRLKRKKVLKMMNKILYTKNILYLDLDKINTLKDFHAEKKRLEES